MSDWDVYQDQIDALRIERDTLKAKVAEAEADRAAVVEHFKERERDAVAERQDVINSLRNTRVALESDLKAEQALCEFNGGKALDNLARALKAEDALEAEQAAHAETRAKLDLAQRGTRAKNAARAEAAEAREARLREALEHLVDTDDEDVMGPGDVDWALVRAALAAGAEVSCFECGRMMPAGHAHAGAEVKP